MKTENQCKISSKPTFVFFIFIFVICIFFSLTIVDRKLLSIAERLFNKTLRNPNRWIEIIRHTSFLLFFVTMVAYFLNFIELGKKIFYSIKSTIKNFSTDFISKKLYFHFAFICFFLFIAFFKIIISNFFYADDIFRNYTGNRSWIGFSRYVSEFLSILVHTNIRLNDIAPISHILTILVMSITVLVANKSLNSEKCSVLNTISLSLIFISPFFSENFSYRFDCLYMAIAIFFSVFPFLFKNDKYSFAFVSILSLILTSMSYQSALGVYIVFTIFIFFQNFLKKEKWRNNICFAAISICSFIFAMIIFKLFFMNTMSNSQDNYFSAATKLSSLFPNILTYLRITFSLYGNNLMKILFLLSLAGSIVIAIIKSKENKILTFFISLLALVISYILSFGPYLIFERPVFYARAFMGFNAFIALIVFFITDFTVTNSAFLNTRKSIAIRIMPALLVYASIVFQNVYGNCLANQKEYENYRMTLILCDLNDMCEKSENYFIDFKGEMDFSGKNRIALRNYPLLSQLIPRMPRSSSSWNDDLLNGYNFTCKQESLELTEDFVEIKKSYYHTIYRFENSFIVILNTRGD